MNAGRKIILSTIVWAATNTVVAHAQPQGQARYHVFPQFAHGRLPDGSSYKTTLMVAYPSLISLNAKCTLVVMDGSVAFPNNILVERTFEMVPFEWEVVTVPDMNRFTQGWVYLNCDHEVSAHLVYALYDS